MKFQVSLKANILLLALVGTVLISNTDALTCYTCSFCDTVGTNTNTSSSSTSCYYCQKIWVNYLFFTGTHRGCMTSNNDCKQFDDRFWGMGRMGSCCTSNLCNHASSVKSSNMALALFSSIAIPLVSMLSK